jgi:plastocyanin domain-containing protein
MVEVTPKRTVTLLKRNKMRRLTKSNANKAVRKIFVGTIDIKRALPLNEPVLVKFTEKSGTLTFTCGIGMLRGSLRAIGFVKDTPASFQRQ